MGGVTAVPPSMGVGIALGRAAVNGNGLVSALGERSEAKTEPKENGWYCSADPVTGILLRGK
jgi:hypothetical protein